MSHESKIRKIKNAADIEFNARRFIPTGNNKKYTKKDITSYALKYHPNKLTDDRLRNNQSFQNRVKLIIEGKDPELNLIGYKPHNRRSQHNSSGANATNFTNNNREYAKQRRERYTEPQEPRGYRYRERNFQNTPFGNAGNWQCCICGAIVHAAYWSLNECPNCGAIRGEGCENNVSLDSGSINGTDRHGANEYNNNSYLYNKPSKQSRRTRNYENIGRENLNTQRMAEQNAYNNFNNNEMNQAYEAFMRGNIGTTYDNVRENNINMVKPRDNNSGANMTPREYANYLQRIIQNKNSEVNRRTLLEALKNIDPESNYSKMRTNEIIAKIRSQNEINAYGGGTKKLMRCKNDKSRTYKGTEPSPKGKGYCAHAENVGSKKKGKDGNMWEVKQIKNGSKRWIKVHKKN